MRRPLSSGASSARGWRAENWAQAWASARNSTRIQSWWQGQDCAPRQSDPLDARTAPVRRGMAAGQLPVTDADALKPPEYGLNVDDSQFACAAQQFAAPHEHNQDDTGDHGFVDRRSSCLFRIGSSHVDLTEAESNAEKTELQRGIVIIREMTARTSSGGAPMWNPGRATTLANG